MSVSGGWRAGVGVLAMLVVLMLCVSVGASASLASGEPWWRLSSGARPSLLPRGGIGEIVVTAENYGDASADGTQLPITIADHLPKDLHVRHIAGGEPINASSYPAMTCSEATVSCSFEAGVAPYGELEMRIEVEVSAEELNGEANQAVVSGGGAASAAITRPVRVGDSGEPVPFGLEEWGLYPENEGGGLDTQAGSHPFQVTGSFVFEQEADSTPRGGKPQVLPAGLAKDIVTELPPGLVGNPIPIPRCALGQFLHNDDAQNECPADTAVGVAAVTVNAVLTGVNTFTVPIFNVEPYKGEPARFGFFIPESDLPVMLDTSVRSKEKYAITVGSTNIAEVAGLLSVRTTFWGDPGSQAHDESRGWACLYESKGLPVESEEKCVKSEETHPAAFLTLPTNCEEPLQASTEVEAWNVEGRQTVPTTERMPTLDGCNGVAFAPTIEVSPTTTFTAAPSGLNLSIDFANEGLTSTAGNAQSELKETTVTLPEGLTINPSAGIGLAGCTPADYERETLESQPGAGCPNESKLGTVEIETPLLAQPIDGNVFIAQPYENPFDSLVALYVVAKNPETGVLDQARG